MQSICLALVVKDGADSIVRCIESARPLIDRWLIIDTGSTDGTQDAVRAALEGVPGRLLESAWVDFATNRTELIARANESGAEYVLMLDADLTVELDGEMPELTSDEYHLTLFDRGYEYALPLLTSASKPFFYDGVAHACLNCSVPVTVGDLKQIRVIDHGGGPGKDGKFERDLRNLNAKVVKDPDDTRSWFYLAQTYKDLDMVDEAIAAYKRRAEMGGWVEEVYWSLFQVGQLLVEHRDYAEGVPFLLRAWQSRPNRVEALRALAGVTTHVANKMASPEGDKLFVDRGAHRQYTPPRPAPETAEFASFSVAPAELPPEPPIAPARLRRRPRVTARKGLDPRDVSAVIVSRGNVDLEPCLATLPYGEVVVWNNSEREHDYKVFGRYAAIPETKNPVIYWQDDDVVFTAHEELLRAYEPGRVVCNMDQGWIDGAGYGDFLGMIGAGSLCDASIPAEVFARYRALYPFDDDLLLECDFAFGTMAPFKRVDLGYEARPFTDDADRLYRQPGQTERKWAMINRGRALVDPDPADDLSLAADDAALAPQAVNV